MIFLLQSNMSITKQDRLCTMLVTPWYDILVFSTILSLRTSFQKNFFLEYDFGKIDFFVIVIVLMPPSLGNFDGSSCFFQSAVIEHDKISCFVISYSLPGSDHHSSRKSRCLFYVRQCNDQYLLHILISNRDKNLAHVILIVFFFLKGLVLVGHLRIQCRRVRN